MAPGGRNLERTLGRFLPFDLLEVGAKPWFFGDPQHRFGQLLHAFEVIEQADQIGRREDRDAAGPARLAALRGGADQPFVLPAGVKRGEQHAGRRDDPAIQ